MSVTRERGIIRIIVVFGEMNEPELIVDNNEQILVGGCWLADPVNYFLADSCSSLVSSFHSNIG